MDRHLYTAAFFLLMLLLLYPPLSQLLRMLPLCSASFLARVHVSCVCSGPQRALQQPSDQPSQALCGHDWRAHWRARGAHLRFGGGAQGALGCEGGHPLRGAVVITRCGACTHLYDALLHCIPGCECERVKCTLPAPPLPPSIALQGALTIAVRYSAQRQQFGPPDAAEISVLDYPSQQLKLMPMLATAYALHFAKERLVAK